MSKRPFQVGDRVAAYYKNGRVVGTVEVVVSFDEIHIRKDKGGWVHAHPKQCRRLKKRERRRVWVNFYPKEIDGQPSAYASHSRSEADKIAGESRLECVEFVEVRRKEGK